MNRTFLLILSIVLIICAVFLSKYFELKQTQITIQNFNSKYEKFINKEIQGTDIASIINQAVDDNEKQWVKKDETGKYIQDEEKSINIEIKIPEFSEKQVFTMEALYNGGMSEFVRFYGRIPFKCTKIEYNSNKRVKYMMFEQIK